MNLINKMAKIVLMIVFILCIFTGCVKAAIPGKVIADNIRLRKEPNTDSKILILVSINEKVEVLEKQGEWYKISYKENTGYIKKEFIELEEEISEEVTQSEEKIEEEQNNIKENVVEENKVETKKTVASTQSIYILPLINASKIAEIQPNTEIDIIQNINGWSYVMTTDFIGWIRTDKLVNKSENVEKEKVSEEPKEQEVEKQEEKIKKINKTGYIKKTSVNLRKGPSTDNEKVASLTLNTEVKVISEEKGWYKIEVNKKTGYIMKDLVSFEKVEVTSRNSEIPRQNEEQTKNNTNVSNNATDAQDIPTDKNSTDLGKQIVDYAMTFVGYPYVYGGTTPKGFDCSGFTSYVYKHFGYSISRTSAAQAGNGKAVEKADLQPGDLVLFKGQNSSNIGHVGIYIGNNQFVHASTAKTGVKVSSLSSSGYIKRYVTARRII